MFICYLCNSIYFIIYSFHIITSPNVRSFGSFHRLFEFFTSMTAYIVFKPNLIQLIFFSKLNKNGHNFFIYIMNNLKLYIIENDIGIFNGVTGIYGFNYKKNWSVY